MCAVMGNFGSIIENECEVFLEKKTCSVFEGAKMGGFHLGKRFD